MRYEQPIAVDKKAMIDLKDLKYVEGICRAGSIKKAADSLGITQPSLTRRIKKLEENFQVKIFDRHRTGVRLTASGELFLNESRKFLTHFEDFKSCISEQVSGKGGFVSVGIKPGLEDSFFRSSLIEYTENYPETSLRITLDTTPVLSEKLKAGRIDFALGALGYADENDIELVLSDDLEFQPMYKIPLELFVRKGHPITQRNSNPDDIFKYPLISPTPPIPIRNAIKKAAILSGNYLNVPHVEVDDYRFVSDIVSRTNMWSAIFSSSYSRLENKDEFEFLGPSPHVQPIEIGLVKRKTWSITPWAQNLVDIIEKHASEWKIDQ